MSAKQQPLPDPPATVEELDAALKIYRDTKHIARLAYEAHMDARRNLHDALERCGLKITLME